MITQTTETFAEIGTPSNPFPGLRPFEFDESHLFFGRDGQSEQLIGKLARTRFLAVVGSSGSGKSSLVRAGLLPALLGGFMTSAGSDWRIAILRPGNDPIGNLARALNARDVFGSEIDENVGIQNAIGEANLRRGSRGLVEAVRQNSMPDNENLLVLVDQFEELFRFAREASRKTKDESERYQNDAAAFVKLLLEAHSQREANIYVVLTMRSDFLGDCAQFWDLPETVNESQYLTPRLTRDQLREAITGPVAVGGGEITPRLVNRLLNDVGDNQDQLPVLQHLLMRAWDEWKQKRLEVEVKEGEGTVRRPHKEVHQGEAIDLCCYEAVGGMPEALSRHADEAFNELPDDRHREVAEKIFKALTEKGPDNREIRRPIMLAEICAVTHAAMAEVVTVVDTFRLPGRSFLMPPAGTALNSESLIDISHESLIRGWTRLRDWVEEEARSARIYRRLAETAELHREGRAGLWGDPDLQLALDWQEKNAPNRDWARRYYPGFETAIAFLQASEQKRDSDLATLERAQREEAERTRRELQQAKALAEAQQQRAEAEKQKADEQRQRLEEQARAASRLRRFIAALVVAAVFALGVAVIAYLFYREAEAANISLNAKIGEAGELSEFLKTTNEFLNTKIKEAGELSKSLKTTNESLNKKIKEAGELSESLQIANGTLNKKIKETEALSKTLKTTNESLIASNESLEAAQKRLEEQIVAVNEAREVAENQSKIAFARQLASESERALNTSPSSLQRSALLAIESLKQQSTLEGDQALRKALSLLPRQDSLKKHEGNIRRNAFSQDGKYVATVTDNQAVRVWETTTGHPSGPSITHASQVTAVTLSPDGKYLVTASDDHTVQLILVATGQRVGASIKPTEGVSVIALSPDSKRIATATDSTVQMWDAANGKPVGKLMEHINVVNDVAFSSDGKYLATGCGKLRGRGSQHQNAAYIWEASTGQQVGERISYRDYAVLAVSFSADGKYLAIGNRDGTTRLWQIDSGQEVARLNTGDYSVTAVTFSRDGEYLATAGLDNSARVWRLAIDSQEVARMIHDSDVSAISFSRDGRHLFTASSDGTTRQWEARPREANHNEAQAITFSQDGTHLITASPTRARRWKADTGEAAGRPFETQLQSVAGEGYGKAAFSSDGKYLVAARGLARVWNLDTQQELATFKPKDWINSVAVGLEGKYLATLSDGHRIQKWDLRFPGVAVAELTSEEIVKFISISPDGKYLATAHNDKTVRLWYFSENKHENESRKQEITRLNHDNEVTAVVFSPDGRHLATASGNTVLFWEAATGKSVGLPIKHRDRVNAIAFNPRDGRFLVTASQDNTAQVWDVLSRQPVGAALKHDQSVNAVVFCLDGKYFATGSASTVRVWELATGKQFLQPINLDRKAIAIALSQDAQFLLTASEDNTARVWKVSTGGLIEGYKYENDVTGLAYSPNGQFLITGGKVGGIWEMLGQRSTTLLGTSMLTSFSSLALSVDGKHLATQSERGIVQIWSVKTQKAVSLIKHEGELNAIVFSPDGKYLATGGEDKTARIWEIPSGKPFGSPLQHEVAVKSISFSKDGKYLATACNDKTVRVWEIVGGKFVRDALVHSEDIFAITFSPDGNYLAAKTRKNIQVWDLTSRQVIARIGEGARGPIAFSGDGKYLTSLDGNVARIWFWRREELVRDTCSRLGRNLTKEEWELIFRAEPYRKSCEGLPIGQKSTKD
jgi:WD40 repeat protein